MKRALSLIIVLAMVLCMIPFSAFAVDTETGFGEPFVDGVITLPADGELSYLWTATEDGTVEVFAEAIIPEVAEGEEVPALAEPYILVDGADYTEAFAVTAGQSYEITFGDDAGIGGDVTVYTVFKGLPGTETNPYEYYNPTSGLAPEDQAATTVSVEPGASVYYNLYYYANTTVKISGAGVEVVKGEETIDGTEAGYVEFAFASNDRVVLIKITNKDAAAQTYTIEGIVPVGTMDNPEVVESGEYQANLTDGNQGYYYTYFAEGDGVVNVNVYAQDAEGNTLGTMLAVNNLTSYVYGDQTTEGTWSVEVAAGDEISIMASTFDEADPWNAPAGTVTTVITFSETEPEPEVGIDWGSVLDGVTSHTNDTDAEVFYTYTVEQDGMLYRSDYGFNFFVSAGDPVNIYIAPGETVELYYATPVAMIGDAEYYSFDEAVASAMYGDTIVLLADVVSEWDGISLKPGINLNLGEFTLTAPYVIAFGEVTGVVGSASIVADDVMLNNVTIDGVEYAWTAGENGYTLVSTVKAPVAKNNTTGKQYASVAVALDEANGGDTIELIASPEEKYVQLNIRPGITLNVGTYILKAETIIGVSGAYLTADTFHKTNLYGSVYADALVLSTAPYNSSNQTYTIPVWNVDHYVFGVSKASLSKQAVVDGIAQMTISLSWTGAVRTELLATDGASNNKLSIVAAGSWNTTQGRLEQELVFDDKNVMTASSSSSGSYNVTVEGGDTKEKLVLTAKVITDCGIVVEAPVPYQVTE